MQSGPSKPSAAPQHSLYSPRLCGLWCQTPRSLLVLLLSSVSPSQLLFLPAIMRYDDWDVLLFPTGEIGDARVPLKEFKVDCHVVPDTEFGHTRGTFGMPAMTCFVPSLNTGAQFHISIHSWGTPQISQHTLSSTKHPNLVKFEARIFIDGRMVA